MIHLPNTKFVLFYEDSNHIFYNSEISRNLDDEKQYVEYWGEKSLMRNYRSITVWREHKFLHKQATIHYIVWKKSKKEVGVKIAYRKESEHRSLYNSVQILWAQAGGQDGQKHLGLKIKQLSTSHKAKSFLRWEVKSEWGSRKEIKVVNLSSFDTEHTYTENFK